MRSSSSRIRARAVGLSCLLILLLFVSPKATLAFLCSLVSPVPIGDCSKTEMRKLLKRQQRNSAPPMETARGPLLRKGDSAKGSVLSELEERNRAEGSFALGPRPPAPNAGRVESTKPLYLRLFLPGNPHSYRSPPSPLPVAA